MSKIRAKNTKPEELFENALKEKTAPAFKKQVKMVGKPDFAFEKQKTLVFVDGCFWHRCPEHFVAPETNKEFWEEKIGKNVLRDRKNEKELEKQGWKIIRIWEHEIKANSEKVAEKVIKRLNSPKEYNLPE